MQASRSIAVLAAALLAGLIGACTSSADEKLRGEQSDAIAAVRDAHGRAGPWAVAGYRMGERALRDFGLPRGSFDLEVIHHSPRDVQYSCVADGAGASTGASVGKLNLTFIEAPSPAATRTEFRNKKSGASLVMTPAPSFVTRFANIPHEKLEDAGREVLALPDAEIFIVEQGDAATTTTAPATTSPATTASH